MDDSSTSLNKRDYRKTPFKVAVALGESTTAGGTATRRELTWVHRLGQLIDEAQLEPIRMINSGLGANLISPRSPAYDSSGKPSAMERYVKHVLAHGPDLVLISLPKVPSSRGKPSNRGETNRCCAGGESRHSGSRTPSRSLRHWSRTPTRK